MGTTVEVGDEAALARAIEAAKAVTDRRPIGDRLSAHVRHVYDWREINAATEAMYYDVLATTSRRRGGRGCGS